MATTIFDKPSNDIEKEIAAYIKPMLTPQLEAKIAKEKLTLAGCWEFCKKEGKKYAKNGCAKISDKQHWTWVGKYFGIKGLTPPGGSAEKAPESKRTENTSSRLRLDVDELLDI